MQILFMLLGLVAGGYVLEWPGALLGAVIGYLLAQQIQLGNRLQALENRLQQTGSAPAAPTLQARTEHAAAAAAPDQPEWTEAAAPTRPYVRPPAARREPEPEDEFLFETAPSPRPPGWLQKVLTGGNLLVKVGVVVLFFGVAFLLKYAAEHTDIPIGLRLAFVALGGCALIALGWRLRLSRDRYAQVLQGGGVGILYLTVFAALRLYQLLPPTLALLVLAAMAVLAAALAVLQNAPALAILGAAGGFLAPILTSTGSGNHVQLFSYYALLNLGILAAAWFKAWRALNLVGFVSTFGIGALWGYRYYQPAYFASVEPFLALFFLLYVATAVLFALRQPPQLKGYADGSLIFGTPLVAAGLQAALVRDFEFGMAWSALALGLFYLGLAGALLRARGKELKPLIEAFLALGIIFASLAIPLAFDGRWTSAAWAVEGAGILWIGLRQQRLAPRVFGLLLQLGAGLAFALDPAAAGPWPLLNAAFLGGFLLAAAGLASAFWLFRLGSVLGRNEGGFPLLLLGWGLFWWFATGIQEIERHSRHSWELGLCLILVAGSALALEGVGSRLDWRQLRLSALLLLPAIALGLGLLALDGDHPGAGVGWLAWPLAFVSQYLILHRRRELPPWLDLQHGATLWLLVLAGAWEIYWQIDHHFSGSELWALLPWGLGPALAILAISRISRHNAWPVERLRTIYMLTGAGPLALAALTWSVHLNLYSDGNPWPLPYLPLLNPLDLAQGLIYAALIGYWMQLRREELLTQLPLSRGSELVVLGIAGCFWLSALVVRTVHHWGKVPFDAAALYDSVLLQAALALTWSLAALAAMVLATRSGWRPLWLAGAGLLGLVVVKLFVVDLAGTGTLARIVSFLGVGSLLLLIGYLAPVPPRQPAEEVP